MKILFKNVVCAAIIASAFLFGGEVVGQSGGFAQFTRTSGGTSGCANSQVVYTVAWGNGPSANSISVSGSGYSVTGTSGNDSGTSGERVYTITWSSSGSITATIYWQGGTSTTLSTHSFTVQTVEAGAISGPASVCSGTSANLNVSGNAGAVVFQKFVGGVWTDLASNNTGNLTASTDFRARSDHALSCGTDYTNTITIAVTPRVSLNYPTVNPNFRYVGDDNTYAPQASVSGSNHTGTFDWTVMNGSTAVASPAGNGSTTNLINWSSTFVGTATVSVTAHGCDNSTDTKTVGVTVYNIPTPTFQQIESLPPVLCSGTVARYRLQAFGATISNAVPSITGGGTNVQAHPSNPNEWYVTWSSDGSIQVSYSISKDGRTWSNQHVSLPFDVAEAEPGTISFPGSSTMCAGSQATSGNINISGNSGSVTYWYCTSGCSSANDNGWTQMSGNAYSNLATNTSFRAKLVNTSCGTKYSNTITATIAPLPTDILVNGPPGVCQNVNNAKIVLNYGEADVVYRLIKDGSATSYTITGPGPTETGGRIEFTNQGIGVYKVLATKGTCSREMSGVADVTLLSPAPFVVTTNPVQPIAICPGTEISFSTTGGTQLHWASTRNDLSQQQQTALSFSIVPGDDATYTVTGEDINCHTPVSVQIAVDVKPVPNYADKTATLCSGQSTNFNLSSSEGTTFTWTVNPPSSVSGASNSVSPVANNSTLVQTLTTTATSPETIVYQIVGTLNGCAGATRTATVTLKPTPQITVSNQNTFSTKDFTITLSPTLEGTTTSWTTTSASGVIATSNGSTTNSSIVRNLTTSAQADGVITFIFTPSYLGCTGTSKNAVITVFAIPVIQASVNPLVKGGPPSVLSTNPALENGSGNWYRDDQSLTVAQSISTRKPGVYKVYVTRNGISAWTEPFSLGSGFNGQNLNYLITDVVQKAGISTPSTLVLMSSDSVIQSIQYFDGLGRPMQSVMTQSSPASKDVIVPYVYDAFGREYKKLLPVTKGNDGSYKNVITAGDTYSNTAIDNFYSGGVPNVAIDGAPFSKNLYDNSPLNRVVKQGAPGTVWQPEGPNSVTTEYLYNNDTPNDPLAVLMFHYEPIGGNVALGTGQLAYYPPNALTAVKTIDEQSNHVIEFTDKEGKVVCKKVWVTGTTYACTYYLYDDFGNLAVVLPPEAITHLGN